MAILNSLLAVPVSEFLIQEIRNEGGGGLLGDVASVLGPGTTGRKLRLQGRGLPYRPFSLSTSQRLTVTWLPGYAEGTAQALGAKEEITSVRGKWSDKWVSTSDEAAQNLGPLGNAFAGIDNAIGAAGARIGLGSAGLGQATNETIPIAWDEVRVQTATDAVDIVDELVRTAVLVEVLWGPQARRGFITKFSKDWLNAHDVEWEMEFTWIGRATAPEAVQTAELSLGSTVSLFQKLSDALNLEALPPTFPMANDVLRDVQAGITRIATTTQAIADTVGNIAALALSPFNVARSMVALLETLRGQAVALGNTLTGLMPGGLYTNRSGASVVNNQQTSSSPQALRSESQQSFASASVAAEYVGRVRFALKAIISAALVRKDDYQRKIDREVTAVVTVREGQDLRELAQTYYGSPQEWKRIAQANGLTSARLTAGTSIVIPKFNNADRC